MVPAVAPVVNYVDLRGTLEDRFNDDRGDGGVVCVGENLDDVRDQLRVLLVGELPAVVEAASLQQAVGLGQDTDTWTTQRSIRGRDCSYDHGYPVEDDLEIMAFFSWV